MTFKSIEPEELEKSITLLQPTTPFLVTTINEDNSINIAPFAWGGPISFDPPMFSLALLNEPRKQDSLKNIERTKEFVVNLIDMDIAQRVVEASYEYPEGINKFEELNFKEVESDNIDTPGITEARAHLECKVKNFHKTGDHKMIISDIIASSYNSDYYTGDLLLDLRKANPMFHLEQYEKDDGQVHVFIKENGTEVLNIPYKVKLDLDF